jgi:urease accessory protein
MSDIPCRPRPLVGSVAAVVAADWSATAGARPRQGAPRLTALSCSGALALRPAGDALYLVGAGAHPVGGDETAVRLSLGDGATARVASVGATLARRGLPGEPSRQRVELLLGDGAALDWAPQPGIAATGCDHHTVTVVEMAPTARLSLAEEVVLGRHGEDPPGSWTMRTEVVLGDRPLLVSELGLGPASRSWRSATCFAGACALVSLVLVDPAAPAHAFMSATADRPGAAGVALPLAGPGIELLAWGADLAAARLVLERLRSTACKAGCWAREPDPVDGDH